MPGIRTTDQAVWVATQELRDSFFLRLVGGEIAPRVTAAATIGRVGRRVGGYE